MTHATIQHNSIVYDVTLTDASILQVRRTFEDSGIGDVVPYDHLPKIVKDRILTAIRKAAEHDTE